MSETLETSILGTWQKLSDDDCAALYPQLIEILEGGIYAAQTSDDAFFLWQSGDYVLTEDHIQLQSATDAMLDYELSVSDDNARLSFTDQNGCEFSYERIVDEEPLHGLSHALNV